jgi:hypothetical protein
VVADEAHRSQYGFKGRVVTTKEDSEIRYGNAKYLRTTASMVAVFFLACSICSSVASEILLISLSSFLVVCSSNFILVEL